MKINCLLEYMKKNSENEIAVFCKDRKTIKYENLRNDVLKMYSYISGVRGIKKGEYIGLVGENSYEWILVDLACLIGGWISVSFHAKDFEVNKRNLIKKYNMNLVFADEQYCERGKKYVCLNKVMDEISLLDYSNDNLEIGFSKKDIFTIIYTSGTTGTPKALKIKLEGVENFINGFYGLYDFKSDDKVFIFLPLSVLTCRAYIYAAIMGGLNILLANMATFSLAMKVGQPTILQGVPHLFETVYDTVNKVIQQDIKKRIAVKLFFFMKKNMLLSKKLSEKLQQKYFKAFYDFWGGKMRIMITGSSSIRKNVLEFYNYAGIPLYEAYGINEGGVLAINYPNNMKIGSVGKPFMHRQIRIAEDGEVLVRNDIYAFSTGYFDDNPELDKNVYRKDGYIATGDIGYFDDEGFLYLCGRKKEIITLSNGEKIMPAILENRIKDLSCIKQVCLVGSEKPFVVAIVTPSSTDIQTEDVLNEIQQLKKEDAEYGIIKDVILTKEPFSIDNKQLNVNLKLARKEIVSFYSKELNKLYGA